MSGSSTEVVGAESAGRPAGRTRRILRSRSAAGLGLAVMTVLVWARPVLSDFAGARLSNPGDSESFAFYLAWNVHAVLNGENPFTTPNMYAPQGMDLGNAISIPAVSVLVAPVTLLWGATAGYNVAFLVAILAAAVAVLLLAREWTGSASGSLVAGALVVVSPYFSGHALGHLNMMWVVALPGVAFLVVRHVRGRMRGRWLVVGTAVLVAFTLGASTELMVTQVVFGAVALGVGLLFAPAGPRRRILACIPLLAAGGAGGAVLAAPVIWAALRTGVPEAAANPPSQFSTDLTNLVVPTPNVLIGDSFFQDLRSHWMGNVAENTAYVPLTMLVLAGVAVVWVRNRLTLGLAAFAAISFVLSLGPVLTIAGYPTVPMPWRLAELLPGLNHALPGRFSAFVFMALAVLVAIAWSTWRSRLPRLAVGVGIAVSCVLLLPSPSLGWPVYPTPTPVAAYVSSGQLTDDTQPDENVLVLPSGQWGPGLRWMEVLDFSFRTPTGNGGGAAPPPQLKDPTAAALFNRDLAYDYADRLLPYLRSVGVQLVLVDEGHPEWRAVMDAVLPGQGRSVGGVLVYRVP
ncbi:hypothetical protein [Klenkia marina]|uniref:hypothetical protein n=1 Tax=Klenkia marina TaxID=1960309 RepID=UPI001059F5CC|nr:hypothetical protein [Klenkia marina]